MRTKTSAGALGLCFFQPAFYGGFAYCRERNLFDFCVVIAGCFDVMFDFSPVRHEKAGSPLVAKRWVVAQHMSLFAVRAAS